MEKFENNNLEELQMDIKKLRARALLGLPITAKEEAIFLLFIATYDEAMLYLDYKR